MSIARHRMKAFVVALLLTSGLAAQSQPQPHGRMFRIGVVFASVPMQDLSGPAPANGAAAALVKGLEDHGWVQGRNIEILWRSAETKHERLPGLIEELVQVPIDVMVVNSE